MTRRRRLAGWFTTVALVASVLGGRWPVSAAPGEPDRGFGTDGVITTDFDGGTDQARALVVQPDGKVVAAGAGSISAARALGGEGGLGARSGLQFALARYRPDGSLDPTFSGDGKVTTDIADDDAQALAVVLQPDGNVVAAGGAVVDGFGEFALARYLPDGALDPTFDGDGKLTTGFAGPASASALLLQSSGEVVAAGFAREGDRFQFALARYLPHGALDPSFGDDGKLTAAIADADAEAFAAALQPDGKVLAAGFAVDGGSFQFALARFEGALFESGVQ
jgi:uncharacterized delta-60 repeat protein